MKVLLIYKEGAGKMKVDETNLIDELKRKNPKALDYLVDRYSNLIFKAAYSVLNSKELSEECVNEVLLKIWESINSFNRDKSKFTTWIIIITKYTSIDYIRKEKKHSNVISIDDAELNINDDVDEEITSKELREKLLCEIKKMDNENKEIFIRRLFLREPIKEIGERLGITESAVSNRLLRGKKKLMRIFKEEVS